VREADGAGAPVVALMPRVDGLRQALRACAAAAVLACGAGDPTPTTPPAAFAGSAACVECHADAFEAWSGSHHDRAMQVANDETVLGDFDDASFPSFPVVTRLSRSSSTWSSSPAAACRA
jgi:hypothetical protein